YFFSFSQPPESTLFPYTTLFRSNVPVGAVAMILLARIQPSARRRVPFDWFGQASAVSAMGALTYGAIEAGAAGFRAGRVVAAFRSEEHTSELQSRFDLVCRLLLE